MRRGRFRLSPAPPQPDDVDLSDPYGSSKFMFAHFFADANLRVSSTTGGVGMLAGGCVLAVCQRQHYLAAPGSHTVEVVGAGARPIAFLPLSLHPPISMGRSLPATTQIHRLHRPSHCFSSFLFTSTDFNGTLPPRHHANPSPSPPVPLLFFLSLYIHRFQWDAPSPPPHKFIASTARPIAFLPFSLHPPTSMGRSLLRHHHCIYAHMHIAPVQRQVGKQTYGVRFNVKRIAIHPTSNGGRTQTKNKPNVKAAIRRHKSAVAVAIP